MPEKVQYLEIVRDAFAEVGDMAGQLNDIVKQGDEQANVRDGAIRTIHQMCDALQLACDLISKEISSSIVEYGSVRYGPEEAIRGFFQRTAFKYSDQSLRLLLHEGKVCGELHALGDRFTQPLSPESRSAVPFMEAIKMFFRRSSTMSIALDGLYEGEMNYLVDLTGFLNEIRDHAEQAASGYWGDVDGLRQEGDALMEQMRAKRQTMQDQLRAIKSEADGSIGKLH